MPLRDPIPGYTFGRGVDGLSGSNMGDGVILGPVREEAIAKGRSMTLRSESVESLEELASKLDTSVDASAGTLMVSGGGRFALVNSSQHSRYSFSFVVHTVVVNSFRQFRGGRLSDEASRMLEDGTEEGRNQFREHFGDHFVRGERRGGEYFAVVRIDAESAEELTQIQAGLRAEGLLGSVSASTSLSVNARKYVEKLSHEVFQYQSGGGVAIPLKTSFEEMLDKASGLATEVAGENAHVFKILVDPYEVLDHPKKPNFVDYLSQRDTLQNTLTLRSSVIQMRNDADYVIEHSEQFEPFDQGDLRQTRDKLQTAIDALSEAAKQCSHSIKRCQDPVVTIPALSLPTWKSKKLIVPAPDITLLDGDVYRNQYSWIPDVFPLDMGLIEDDSMPVNSTRTEMYPLANSPVSLGQVLYWRTYWH